MKMSPIGESSCSNKEEPSDSERYFDDFFRDVTPCDDLVIADLDGSSLGPLYIVPTERLFCALNASSIEPSSQRDREITDCVELDHVPEIKLARRSRTSEVAAETSPDSEFVGIINPEALVNVEVQEDYIMPSSSGLADILSLDVLQTSTQEGHQDPPPPSTWAQCDDCFKWRRVEASHAASIRDSRWTCKDNMDHGFADCLVPQEKSDDAIDAELKLSVKEKLSYFLDDDKGISETKGATIGYLKLLQTAASGEIQSERDLLMILDALLKTKPRMVLVDILKENGLQMLHNIMKRCISDITKIPILRKILQVFEYLAMMEILTLEHINGGPLRPGVESLLESILTLTEHNDKQLRRIARNFQDTIDAKGGVTKPNVSGTQEGTSASYNIRPRKRKSHRSASRC